MQTELKEVQAKADKKKPAPAPAPEPAFDAAGMLLTVVGYIVCAVAILIACYFAMDIRMYAIRTYGTVIHEFGTRSHPQHHRSQVHHSGGRRHTAPALGAGCDTQQCATCATRSPRFTPVAPRRARHMRAPVFAHRPVVQLPRHRVPRQGGLVQVLPLV